MTFSEFYEASDFKSDKGTTHDYINGYYSNEFTSKRNDKLKILEIGVHRGTSMKLLREWFINSEIIGIDPFGDGLPEGIADEIRNIGNITIIQDDGYTQKVLNVFEDEESADLILNENGEWTTNTNFKPFGLILPIFTPTSSNDNSGVNGNITLDENYLYVKVNNQWKRTNLETF